MEDESSLGRALAGGHIPSVAKAIVKHSAASLRYDNQSRTLTCTSTGGPATTVTWRKNGAVVTLNTTYQQTMRVVDPVTGTYQTVLTIGPSVGQSDIGGTYYCTVENARGRSSMMVIVGELILRVGMYAVVTFTI